MKTTLPLAAGGAVTALRVGLLLACLVGTARAAPSDGLPTEFRPSFPLFASGPLLNLNDEQGRTNASAHLFAGIAVPLVAERLWGRQGLWYGCAAWVGLNVLREAFFHAPPNAGPAYAAEVRTDVLSLSVGCVGLLTWDLLAPRGAT